MCQAILLVEYAGLYLKVSGAICVAWHDGHLDVCWVSRTTVPLKALPSREEHLLEPAACPSRCHAIGSSQSPTSAVVATFIYEFQNGSRHRFKHFN